MQKGVPSRTAYGVARFRAGHQVLDGGKIFEDPYACSILGETPDAVAAEMEKTPGAPAMRQYLASRSRIGEDWLGASYARGNRQAVVLGAGFDTFALRNRHADLKVFEVDHPATQNWKRERLASAGIPVPATLTFAPVDFTRDDLAEGLAAAGFDANKPAFFLWLGVVPYLLEADVLRTLAEIARIPCSEVAFDYSEPLENYPPELQPQVASMAKKVAALGEPWVCFFDPPDLANRLRGLGFAEIEDLDRNAVAARISGSTSTHGRTVGAHLIRARR